MADWRDAQTDDPPPYGVDVWIHRVPESMPYSYLDVVIAHRAKVDETHDEWRSYDGATFHSVVAWMPIVPPRPPRRAWVADE